MKEEISQSCLTLCDPMGYSLQGFSVHGIFQARILEWDAFSSPGGLPNPAIKPRSPALQADVLLSEPRGKPSIYFLWKNIYLGLMPIFNFFLILSCVSCLYILEINPLSVASVANIFSQSVVVFSFCLWFSLLCLSF